MTLNLYCYTKWFQNLYCHLSCVWTITLSLYCHILWCVSGFITKTSYNCGQWVYTEVDLERWNGLVVAAENETHEGKRKCEALWPIFKISHQKSRYIYDLFYRRKAISRELFDFCLEQGHADKNLIAKWKKVFCFVSFCFCCLAAALVMARTVGFVLKCSWNHLDGLCVFC